MTADFQQFYGLRLEDVWTGELPVRDVLHRIPGLLSTPYSRFRARYYDEHPPEAREDGPDSDIPGWLGWDGNSPYLVALVNVMLSMAAGKKKPTLLKFPSSKTSKRAQPRTVAEFMKAVRGGALHGQDHG